MRILLLNQFFHPDEAATSQFLTDLALYLAGRGHEIEVICGRAGYKPGRQAAPLPNSIRVKRVWSTDLASSAGIAGKAADYTTFLAAAAVTVSWAKPADVVIALSTPPMLGALGLWAKRRGHRSFVFWVQDIYPEIAQRLGFLRSALANRLLEAAMGPVYRSADGIVALGERMAEELCTRYGVPVEVVHHWPLDASPPEAARAAERRRRAWENDFVLLYSGNLGRAHDARTFLEAFKIFAPRLARARLVFAGDGARRREVAEFKQAHPDLRIEMVPHQPRAELGGFLAAADAHLISQRPAVDGLVVPSKLYGILESGRPVCFVGSADNEIARLLCRHAVGLRVEPGDAVGLAAAFGKIASDPKAASVMGAAGRQLARGEFSREAGLSKLASLIEGSWKAG